MTYFVDRLLEFAAVVVAALLLVAIVASVRQRQFARHRKGEGLVGFRSYFESRAVPPDVAERVYEKVQEWVGEPAFPVRPTDELALFGLGLEHFDAFLGGVVAASGRRASERIIGEAIPRLKTVEDLVRFVAACPAAA